MATYQRGKYWWYRFRFAGERIDEPTKSTSRTVAKEAERQHRRALEAGYNNFKEVRQNRVRILEEIIDEYLTGYRLRYRSASFAEYALGHVGRLLGTKIVADITEISVLRYQEDRLREKAAPKSINEEVRFLLKMLGDPGEVIRAHLKKTKQLKLTVHKQVGKAFDSEETQSLATNAKSSRSPHMYPAFMLARNGGLRDAEIKTLTWGQINFIAKTAQVGRAKSEAGEGRIVPLNSEAFQALVDHRAWYLKRFGEMRDGVREIRDEWYVFPWGKPMPSDPARHITSFKTAWKTTRRNAKVKGRWHDNRHTLITEMAENGAGDETIMEIAGHVDRQMLRHYSHNLLESEAPQDSGNEDEEGESGGRGSNAGQPPAGEANEPSAPTTDGGIGQVLDAPLPDEEIPTIEEQVREWDIAVNQATTVARHAGKVPAGLDRTLEGAAEAAVDWRELLRRFWSETTPADYSWMRPNRRHLWTGLYLPGVVREGVGEVAIAVDCSGSVSARQLRLFEAEVRSILEGQRPERVYVIYFDAVVQKVETYEAGQRIDLNPVGGGGTEFGPCFEWLDDRGIRPQTLVFLTDLYGSFPPSAPSYPVLWASTGRRNAPFGEVIPMQAA